MKHPALFVISAALTLSAAPAEDIRVLVSNTAGAGAYHPTVGAGYIVRPAPHADLNVIWNAATQTFSGGFRTEDETPPVQFGPEDAIAYLPVTGQRQRSNAGEQYDFQGAVGDTFWFYPSSAPASNAALTLFLGFSAYGVARDGTFSNDRIRWTVHSVENLTTPSANSFYGYSLSAGNVNMQLTLDPAYPDREMVMLTNGHSHLNLLFKAPGMYRVTLRVRGTLATTGEEVSSLVPVYFGVEEWKIPPESMTFIAWRSSYLTPAQAADPSTGGPDADPDLDGYNNLLEYALGGDPLVADAGLLGARLVPVEGVWSIRTRQRTDAGDLAFSPEYSADFPSGWRTDALQPRGQPVPVDGAPGISDFIYRPAQPAADRGFFRLRAALQP